jgi:nucleoid DNA-binding protein
MNLSIDEILEEMKIVHGISKFELEKIVDSQFKVLVEHIRSRDIREVHIKGVGKFKPTTYLKALQEGRVIFKDGSKSERRITDEQVY